MSHHEGVPNSELRKQFAELLGEFPNGRLNAKDEGALPLAIGVEGDVVKMTFQRPTAWIGFTPEQAMEIAQLLVSMARKVSKKPLTFSF